MGFIQAIFDIIGRTINIVLSIAGLLLVLIGILLCFTIIGTIVGVPMIFLGLVFVVMGKMIASQTHFPGRRHEHHQPERKHTKIDSGKIVDADYTVVKEERKQEKQKS
jgi:predicted membrane protein